MPWISVVAVRHLLREDLAVQSMSSASAHRIEFRALKALMAGEHAAFEQLTYQLNDIINREFDAWMKSLTPRSSLRDAGPMVTLLALGELLNKDQRDRLAAFCALGRIETPTLCALQRCVCWMLEGRLITAESVWPGGHIEEEREWLEALDRLPPATLFDLALTPDHVLWPMLAHFVVPIGAMLAKQCGLSGVPLDLFYLGAHLERRGELLYERIRPRPSWDEPFDAKDRSTWAGFDGIEEKEGRLLVYHYLGSTFQAPLLLDDEVNSFEFLDQLAWSWKLVEETVDEACWRRIEQRRAEGDCEHVVVYDATVATTVAGHLERAAVHYGVNLTACDMMSV